MAELRLHRRVDELDGDREALDVHNLIRGCWPWPAGRAVFHRDDGKEIVVSIAASEIAPAAGQAVPGTVDEEFLVATGSGRLRILEIKPAGGRQMAWRDFVNGYRVRPGSVFTALQE